MKQLTFDYTYLERKALIKNARLPRGEAKDGTGVSSLAMASVLFQINERLGENADAWPSQERIASDAKMNRRTVVRAVQALEKLSLIIVEGERLRNGHHRNRYRIVWNELQILQPAKKPSDIEPTPCDISAEPSDTTSLGQVTSRHSPCDTTSLGQVTSRHMKLYKRNYSKNSPPLGDVTSHGSADGWQVVVSALKVCGMSDCRGAVTAAQRRELTPADVLDLVDRWERLRVRQQHQVTVGWLYRWITGDSRAPELDGAPPGRTLSQEEEIRNRLESIRARVVRAGRRNRRSDQEIARALRRALERDGFEPDAVGV